jgi:hypothetical protein
LFCFIGRAAVGGKFGKLITINKNKKGIAIMNKKFFFPLVVLAILLLGTYTVLAAVDFDALTGEGFVGKGDVQLAFGWNNKALQENANDVQFQVNSEVVTEVSWICTNTNNDNIQERERTTTSSVAGVLSSVARERNQITGFILEGYDGEPTIVEGESEGPKLDSCPSGPWSLTTPAGDPEVVSSTGGLQVSVDGEEWFDLD